MLPCRLLSFFLLFPVIKSRVKGCPKWALFYIIYKFIIIFQGKPTLQPLPSVEIVEKGLNTEVVCKASGWPAPNLSWWKNGVKIYHGYKYNSYSIYPSSRGPNFNALNMGLIIASNHHHGTYTCRAHNLFGTSTQDINIMIKRK